MNDFARALRTWRQTRRYSQLDLALEAEVSARHISFLETGRARPSRDMIARLGDAMGLPLDAQNTLLTQAGFAARFVARDWLDAQMAPVRAALAHTMDSHAPYPAIALDRDWNIFRLNTPARRIYAAFDLTEGDNLLDLVLSDALPPLVENWPEVAHHTAQRLRTESAAAGGIKAFDAAAMQLAQDTNKAQPSDDHAIVPMVLRTDSMRLALFATIAHFGTPQDLTVDALRIELFFPADDATRQLLEAMDAAP